MTLSTTQGPNILLIFTDDQGYADWGFTGSENKTPNMDQLASEGTVFTDFYVQPACGPSRSAILTGRYPILSKGWDMPATEITFARVLKDAGYQTWGIGKWEVSSRKEILNRMPLAHGFDKFFGSLGANDNGALLLHDGNISIETTKDMAGITRRYTDKAIEYLKQRDPDKPFLLYLAHIMAHMNIDASAKFKVRHPGDLYRAVIEELDHEIGRVLQYLKDEGLEEDTIVIFTSDNGPWNQDKYINPKREQVPQYNNTIFWGDSGQYRGGKGSIYEGGSRQPLVVRWPGKVPAGKNSTDLIASVDLLPTFAALAGGQVPQDRLINGVDHTALWLHQGPSARASYFYFGNSGIRVGHWKYLVAKPRFFKYAVEDTRKPEEELYDLTRDPSETKNLAQAMPEKLAKMRKHFEAALAEMRKGMRKPVESAMKQIRD